MPFKNSFKPSTPRLAASASNKRMRPSLGGTLQRAHLMATGVLCIVALCLVQRVSANTEIENFGPMLCRADAVGLLSDHAAHKVARGWPILVPASTPSRFTIPAAARQDASADRGAWIVLQLTRAAQDSSWRDDEQRGSGEEEAVHQEHARAGEGTSSAESRADAAQVVRPTELASDELPLIDQATQAEVSPRDRFLTHIWHKVAWMLSKRYQLRLSWSASFPAKFWVEVYTPEGMLEAGGISWQAAQKEGPSNDTNAVRSDRAAQASDASSQPRTASGRGGLAQPTGTPQPAQPEGPTVISQADARTPPEAYAQTGGEAPALWPCPRVYARIRAVHDGTPIPVMAPKAPSLLVRLAQTYLGALGPGEHQDGGRQPALHSSNVPIHLILEPLDLGLIPHTALSLLALLLPTMAIAWTICVPLALAACTAALRCAVQRDLHVKAE
ncbi:hypothetical protein IE81DRAFT_349700 [Ceraceosorus guamensis]|uniref:Uncharacterized protein n=1 Tax=Ceraceosorus guamensis TaxID=1522189 RepID=A0A316VQU3_9BASI|nr:hypothetical protein IE81DRAFT_349700 [Ceraceosorus guamensis]PWN39966.1 hypothetical protein IE81DRAFT_349700 [Ceraceosorus guamensis]